MNPPIQGAIKNPVADALRVSINAKLGELRQIAEAADRNSPADPVGAVRRTIDLLGRASPASLDRDVAALRAVASLPDTTDSVSLPDDLDSLFERLDVGPMNTDEWLNICLGLFSQVIPAVCPPQFETEARRLLMHAIANEAWDVAHFLSCRGVGLDSAGAVEFTRALGRLLDAAAGRGPRSDDLGSAQSFLDGGQFIGAVLLSVCANPRNWVVAQSIRADEQLQARIDELARREVFDPSMTELAPSPSSTFARMLAVASEPAALSIMSDWLAMGRSLDPAWDGALAAFRARQENTALRAVVEERAPSGAEPLTLADSPCRKTPEVMARRL